MTEHATFPAPNPAELVSTSIPLAIRNGINGNLLANGNGFLPALEAQKNLEPVVADKDVTALTPARNVEGIHKPAAIEPDGSSEWFEQNIEVGVREAVKTLYKKGFDTFTSSSNKDNFGKDKVVDPHIGLRFDEADPAHQKLFERAAELNEVEAAEAKLQSRKPRFKVKYSPGDNEWSGVYIYISGEQDHLAVSDVSSIFDGLATYLTQDSAERRTIAGDEELNLNSRYGLNKSSAIHYQTKIKRLEAGGAPKGMITMLREGTYMGKRVDDMDEVVRNADNIMSAREYFAEVVRNNPQVAEALFNKGIVGFHGTNSAALAGMVEQGALLSAREAKRRGISHSTGEHLFQKADGQGSISFALVGDVSASLRYAGGTKSKKYSFDEVIQRQNDDIRNTQEMIDKRDLSDRVKAVFNTVIADTKSVQNRVLANPNSLEADLLMDSFPMLIGISQETAMIGAEEKQKQHKYWSPVSGTSGDLSEFRAASEEIDLDLLVIAVPADRVDKVRKILVRHGKSGSNVVPLEPLVSERHKKFEESHE